MKFCLIFGLLQRILHYQVQDYGTCTVTAGIIESFLQYLHFLLKLENGIGPVG